MRGIAILWVVLHHVAQVSPPSAPPGLILGTLYRSLLAGWLGVDVFFVLSGYLITGILLDARGDGAHAPRGYFRSFYARRALRILPLYYLFVIAMLLLHPGTPSGHGTWWYWLFLPNWLFAVYGWPVAIPGTGHIWSLAIEEQFYLVWPALVAWLRPRQLWVVSLALIVAAPLLRVALLRHDNVIAAYLLTPSRADALAFGACAALLVRDHGRRFVPLARVAALVSLAAVIALLLGDHLQTPFGRLALVGGSDFVALLTASCIYLAVLDNRLRWLANPILVSLGTYSYAIYLVQIPLRSALVVPWVGTHIQGDVPKLIANFVGLLALSWTLAWIIRQLIEKPALSLKRFVPMPTPANQNAPASSAITGAAPAAICAASAPTGGSNRVT